MHKNIHFASVSLIMDVKGKYLIGDKSGIRFRISLITFSLIISLLFNYGTIAQDTIHWRADYKLKWEDFQGTPESNSNHGAITSYFLIYNYSLTDTSFVFNVFCFFNKKTSWRKQYVDSQLLHHEQGHFDIGEIHARKLRNAFASYQPDRETIDRDLKMIFDEINLERTSLDFQYDKETNFSRNKIKQTLWSQKIEALLANYL